jgi:small subunit ribosomal protein S20
LAKLANVERRRLRNKSVRSFVKTCTAKADSLIDEKEIDAAAKSVIAAVSTLDKAARKRVIHRNKAARRKSRLMKKLNQATKSQGLQA